jgi:hypothetical protein
LSIKYLLQLPLLRCFASDFIYKIKMIGQRKE